MNGKRMRNGVDENSREKEELEGGGKWKMERRGEK